MDLYGGFRGQGCLNEKFLVLIYRSISFIILSHLWRNIPILFHKNTQEERYLVD